MTSASGIAKVASMFALFKWQGSDSITFKPLFVTSGSVFQSIYYQQLTGWTSDRMMWPALTSSNYNAYMAPIFTFNGVTFSDIQCYYCQSSPFYIFSETVTMTSVTLTNINNLAYNSALCSGYCKQTVPFF